MLVGQREANHFKSATYIYIGNLQPLLESISFVNIEIMVAKALPTTFAIMSTMPHYVQSALPGELTPRTRTFTFPSALHTSSVRESIVTC